MTSDCCRPTWRIVGVIAIASIVATALAEWRGPRDTAARLSEATRALTMPDDPRIMGLDACTCTMPRGGVEARAFIARPLGEGASITEAIARTNSEFGSLKLAAEPGADAATSPGAVRPTPGEKELGTSRGADQHRGWSPVAKTPCALAP